jgi:MFS family permease
VFFANTVVCSVFLWLPKLLQDVSGAKGFVLSTITSVPFAAALLAMYLVGRHSDRTGERRWHVAACATTSAAGLLLAVASQGNIWLLVLSFTLSQMAQRALVGASGRYCSPAARRSGRHRAHQFDGNLGGLSARHHRRAARPDGWLHW